MINLILFLYIFANMGVGFIIGYKVGIKTSVNKREIIEECPFCGSKDLFHFNLEHYKCRDCKEQFTD